MRLRDAVERVGRMQSLDAVSKPISKMVAKAVRPRPVKDALSGSWLGHPLHPLLTDVTISAWTAALVVDIAGGRHSELAARRLIATGLATAVPTAAAGLSDWSDYHGKIQRVGLVHAIANIAAVTCYALSYFARRRGAQAQGIKLSLAGAGALTVGGHLGGHLSYVYGTNVNRNAWHEPVAAGGPLHNGEFFDGCVVCPWHRSVFRLEDGGVEHGPATSPQPAYETRVEDGQILLRSARRG